MHVQDPRQPDPIFSQNFLATVNETNESPSRIAICKTFNSLLDPVMATDSKTLTTEDPDDVIEKFICQKNPVEPPNKEHCGRSLYINSTMSIAQNSP